MNTFPVRSVSLKHAVLALAWLLVLSPVCLFGCATQSHTNPPQIHGPQAAAAYQRLKRLEGVWESKSTKGWGGRLRYQIIAGGTALVQFDDVAHPGEMMLTMIHPDNDRLLLTHFCVAGNQPRLVLTRVSAEQNQFTFEFLDATNLRSRDVGHMDQVILTFHSEDSFSEQWWWYQDGMLRPMETVENRRVIPDASGSSASQPAAAR